MKRFETFFLAASLITVFFSCNKNIDTEQPVINLSFQDAFPVNCDTIYFGEAFMFRVLFTDNAELGSYSLDIHHNFDQHSHTTEVSTCVLDSKKDPDGLNPFIYVNGFDIPEGEKNYETDQIITIPKSNEQGDFEPGDYHLFIRLTDKEGWTSLKGLSIKILHR